MVQETCEKEGVFLVSNPKEGTLCLKACLMSLLTLQLVTKKFLHLTCIKEVALEYEDGPCHLLKHVLCVNVNLKFENSVHEFLGHIQTGHWH